MTWKNDSDAYEQRATYGSIEDQLKTASQKWFNKNYDKTYEQTKAYVDALGAGEYTFTSPYVIADIVADSTERLVLVSYDRINNSVTVRVK